VTFETQVYSRHSLAPLAGVNVSMCRFGDPMCNAPFQGSSVVSDANGFVVARVTPTGAQSLSADTFAQFVQPGYLPALYFLGYPVSESLAPMAGPYVEIPEMSDLPANFDPSLGIVQAQVLDCQGVAAAGVALSISAKGSDTLAFYWQDLSTTSTSAPATTPGGALLGGGFINVPANNAVVVTATPLALGKTAIQAHVVVRAGTFTNVQLYPGTTPAM
jgi:hypothetical protein